MLGQSWRKAGNHAVAGVVACAVAAATVVTGASGVLAAGSGWKIAAAAGVTLPGGRLESVSCSSADACTAVGTDLDTAGINVTLAERWDGQTWQRQPTPNPREDTVAAVSPELTGVSCPAANFCAAVGSYQLGTSPTGLAQTWNGTRWTRQAFPTAPGTDSASLSQVSCASAQVCEAVGFSEGAIGIVPLAATWNGTSWRLQRVPSPANIQFFQLNAVSCASTTFCEAWGGEDQGSPGPTAAEQWNGTSWHRQAVPADATVNSVSCVSASFCEAVDAITAASYTWNGSRWTKRTLRSPADGLSAVSCTSPAFCEAVGAYDNDGVIQGAAETWNGTTWSAQAVPAPPGSGYTNLGAVSCASASTCEAAGYDQVVQADSSPRVVAEGWNGTSWQLQHPVVPQGATTNVLRSVSCVSASFCEAVGYYVNRSGNEADLAETWNGTSWVIQPTPDPASEGSPPSDTLSAVSCVSTQFCAATGTGSPGGFAELWNGTSWTTQTRPGADVEGGSVSCATADFCLSVNGFGQVDAWNGTSWSAGTAPSGFSFLSSVWCVTSSFCETTGSGPAGQDAAAWNGTSWTAQSTPGPASATLNAVWCRTAGSCEAVGAVFGQTTQTLAETWDWSAWSGQVTPNPSVSQSSVLNSVSCTSANACTAVGQYQYSNLGLANTLAEVWNGKAWRLPSTPNPRNAGQNVLSGVSCVAGAACTAAGQTQDTGEIGSALIETGD
jgi:hypothetical protein